MSGIESIGNMVLPGAGTVARGIGKYFGFGAYTTGEAEKILASRVPTMNATLDRGVRIAHHEYISDVNSSIAYAIQSYPLNPGLSRTFPWLSTVASSFQEYELNGALFYFKSTSANALNSTNTALGMVIGATQYNPYLTAPANKVEILGLSSAADGKPSESNLFPIECKADMVLMRSKLVRSGNVTDDLAKYDHGNFFIATVGSQAAAVVGELHIVYDVTLKKPKLVTNATYGAWYYRSYSMSNLAAGATPFAGAISEVNNNLGVTLDATNRVITIPAVNVVGGTRYRLLVTWFGTAAVIVFPVFTLTSNAVAYNGIFNAVSTSASPQAGVNATAWTLEATFQTVASGQDVVLTFGAAGTLPTNSVEPVIE